MSKKHKKVCTTLNYFKHFLILAFDVTGCILISTFVSFLGIPIGITKSLIGLKIFARAAGVKKWKSITKKKKKHNKTILLAKFKLNSIEVLISKALINLNISHDEFAFIDNVLKQYDDTKEEIYKLIQLIQGFSLFIKQCYHVVWSVEKIEKVKTQKL